MFNKDIEEYGKYVDDFHAEPSKLVEMLRRRSLIEEVIQELSIDGRHKLVSFDLKLIKNARKMSEQIGRVYNFTKSEEPLSNWWWQLDKVADGKIGFSLNPIIKLHEGNGTKES